MRHVVRSRQNGYNRAMPVAEIPSCLFYLLTACVTPGPANICSLSAALQYGRRTALVQWLGLFSGFTVVTAVSVCLAYFLGAALSSAVGVLAFAGAGYLLYLAFHMLRRPPVVSVQSDGSCPSAAAEASAGEGGTARHAASPRYITGFLVNVTNVKIMVSCMTVLGSYVLPYSRSFSSLAAGGLMLLVMGPGCNLIWLFAGLSLQKLFARHHRIVNAVLALSLALCALRLVLTGIEGIRALVV